jgi:hypothetical protein
MEPYIFCLISTFVPEHFKILTFMAGGRLVKEERNGCTYANGVLHSFDDKPALIDVNGTQYWYRQGHGHRDGDLPAVINTKIQLWLKEGCIHRENDRPAIIQADGNQFWAKNGEIHRENDQPAIVQADGTRQWFKNGKLHRENDNPAIVQANGTHFWVKNGEIHRENDNPAIIWNNGTQGQKTEKYTARMINQL